MTAPGTPQPEAAKAAIVRKRRRMRRWLIRRWRATTLTTTGAALAAVLVAFATAFGTSAGQQLTQPGVPTPGPTTGVPGHGFTVGVEYDFLPCQAFALPDALTDGQRAASLRIGFDDPVNGMVRFLHDNLGAPQKAYVVKLAFTGEGDRPTRVVGLRVNRLTRSPNLAGTAIYTSCGGDHPTIPVTVDLDKPTPQVIQDGRDYFNDHVIDVTRDDRPGELPPDLGHLQLGSC